MDKQWSVRGIVLSEEGALTCPRCVCQHCHVVIENASEANLNWDWDESGHPTTEAVIVHKKCDWARGSPETCSMPLEVELVWLLYNVGLRGKALAEARESGKLLLWL